MLEQMSIENIYFVPIIGTKLVSRIFFVQFCMTLDEKNSLLKVLECYKLSGFEYFENVNTSYIKSSTSSLPNEMVDLEKYISNCSLCDLYKSKETNFVSLGSISSDIFIISIDSEFYKSDIYKNMLKNMFEKVLDISFENIYLTSFIKCETTNNIPKTEQEIKVCSEYLYHQIGIGKPKLIITLGEAFNFLLNNKQEDVKDVSGNFYKFNNIKTVPLLDPKFLHQNPSYKTKTMQDLNKIKLHLENI